MTRLARERCVACRRGEPLLSPEEVQELLPQVPEWTALEVDGVQQLRREFRFRDFAGALAFANAVGRLAEEEGHHPTLLVEWGRVTVTWWTHVLAGLHRNDFVMAAKTDELV